MNSSFEKSEQITAGLRRSFKDADCKTANRICYGYTRRPDGALMINESEATVVRWIFDQYLAGASLGKLAAGLERMGAASPTGRAKWSREAISKLLSNEKHTGSVLLQKTMSLCGIQFSNDGELEKVLINHHHEAIIQPEVFEQVQQMKHARKAADAKDGNGFILRRFKGGTSHKPI